MDKPMTYWGIDPKYPLVQDIGETWGDFLQEMPTGDRLWLIARVGNELWLAHPEDVPPSDAAEEVRNRLNEIPGDQQVALLRSLINC